MSDFKTLLISDARIANITDKETFAVFDGASQSTYQDFEATTQTATSIVFNLQIPSENIVIDRHLLIQSQVCLQINLSAPDIARGGGSRLVWDYGMTDSLQAFPLNSLCTTQQFSINNATVSQNTKDILPMILRMYDRRKLNRYNSLCPSLPDCFYSEYKSGLGTINNVLAGYNNTSLDEDFVPRGAFPITILGILHTYTDAGVVKYNDSLVQDPLTTNNSWAITLQFTTTEPFICLPPWINTNTNNCAGLVGVNNITANLNIDSTCSRVWSTMNSYITSISLGGSISTINPAGTAILSTTYKDAFTSTKLLFNFLSLQPEQYKKIASKNCVPYLDFPRYLSSKSQNGALYGSLTNAADATKSRSGVINSQSLQLNQVPDLILICVRKPISSQTWTDSSSFLTITNISISFNNTSGILSSANQQQLYTISNRNGSAQSYYEFCGQAQNNYTGTLGPDGDVKFVAAGAGQGATIGTTGSLLVLAPTYDFCLPSYLSGSSLGQYNLYFQVTVFNQTESDVLSPELCIITVNSGIFTTQLGTSIINTGILTKEDVLRTKEETPTMDSNDHRRYIGGSLMNMGSTNIMKLFKNHVMPSDDKSNSDDYNTASGLSAGSLSGGSSRISKLKKYMRN